MMIRTVFSSIFTAMLLASGAFALDLGGLTSFTPAAAPAVPPPSAALEEKGTGCRPFLMQLSVGGVEETIITERVCTPDNASVWALRVERRSARGVFVRVTSEGDPVLEKRIRSMVIDGMTPADAEFVVGNTGAVLRRAALAGDPVERDAVLAEGTERLKAYLRGGR